MVPENANGVRVDGPPKEGTVPASAEPHARHDFSLATIPLFRFGRRRPSESDVPTRFKDTITLPNPSRQRLEREWTLFPSAREGYGGATTQALLFDLHEIWKAQGFRGTQINFGTLRHLYQYRHPGQNPSMLDYARLRRDLTILCGYSFDCMDGFWEPVTRTYGSIRAWYLFTGWCEPTRAGVGEPHDGHPFGFVEVSDTFAKIQPGRGFFVTGFDSAFFHSLRPLEQRLALYLSEMFASHEIHRRPEADIYHALPIEAPRLAERRQTLRDAARELIDKGYPYLAAFVFEKGRWHRRTRRNVPSAAEGAALLTSRQSCSVA